MRTVNLAEAKAGLSALLDAVEAGEEVVITRLHRFHAHQPGPAGSAPQWSCCGSCAIRSHESHGGNLTPPFGSPRDQERAC